MESLLLVGFVIGMRHALEADHVAAGAALAAGGRSARQIWGQGVLWGTGHALALLGFAGLVMVAGARAPSRYAEGLELAVGLMLVVLGLDVVRRLSLADRRLRAGTGPASPGARSRGDHGAPGLDTASVRALLVGTMHGMAGSAALIVLSLHSVRTPAEGVAYITVFGLGSVIGMAAISAVLAVPLGYAQRMPSWMYFACTGSVGAGTAVLGALLVYQVGFLGGLLI
jgi:hypothetical protein